MPSLVQGSPAVPAACAAVLYSDMALAACKASAVLLCVVSGAAAPMCGAKPAFPLFAVLFAFSGLQDSYTADAL